LKEGPKAQVPEDLAKWKSGKYWITIDEKDEVMKEFSSANIISNSLCEKLKRKNPGARFSAVMVTD